MKRAVLIASTLLTVLAVTAQTPTTLRVDVRLVNIVATVTDADGKFVPGLTADDFTVLEDGAAQKISYFTQDHDVPVSVGILLDTSSSMTTKMRTATEAVDRFINYIHPEDDIFLMTFARDTTIEQDFTNDRKKLSRAMNSLHISGGTVLYDALNEAIDKVRTGKHDKRALLVVSDGMDAGSRRTNLESLLRAVRGAEVLIYGLGTGQTVYAEPSEHVPFTLPTQSSAARGPAAIQNSRPASARRGAVTNTLNGVNMVVLNEFAANSGGKAFLLSSTFVGTGSSEIDKAFTLIADELRGQYTLGYYPVKTGSGGSGESNFHTIEVTARNGYNVRARSGYQAQ
jgi:Ca-activated chloride channel homolog